MSFDLIIKNGTVILENEARIVDIAVRAGKSPPLVRIWGGKAGNGCDRSGGFTGHGRCAYPYL